MNALGTHLLLELKGCDPKALDDPVFLERALLSAVKEMGATVLGHSFHKFSPQGVTGIVAIAESHLCLHTWPEYGYAAVDIFTCGHILPHQAAELLIRQLGSREPTVLEIKRGMGADFVPDSPAVAGKKYG